MTLSRLLRHKAVITIAVALWLPAVGYGINTLWKYSTTPGHPAQPPREWPTGIGIKRSVARHTLVMFAHPQCGCTSASLGELEILLAHTRDQVDAYVYFYLPSTQPKVWARTDLWQKASAIPGVKVVEDPDAEMAQRFGVFTSGQALLYSPEGRLLFHGGITAYRGHSGDNAGRSALAALIYGEVPSDSSLPVVTHVFGCSLKGE